MSTDIVYLDIGESHSAGKNLICVRNGFIKKRSVWIELSGNNAFSFESQSSIQLPMEFLLLIKKPHSKPFVHASSSDVLLPMESTDFFYSPKM